MSEDQSYKKTVLNYEEPICACEAIKMSLKQTGKGTILILSLNPDDVTDQLNRIPIGDVIQVYITKKDLGL